MSPQVVLQGLKWLPSPQGQAKPRPIARYSTSAIQHVPSLQASHPVKLAIDEEQAKIFAHYMLPQEAPELFFHFDISQGDGLKITDRVQLTDYSNQNNHGTILHCLTQEKKIELSVCPVNGQRAITGLNNKRFSLHIEPTRENQWQEMNNITLHIALSTSQNVQNCQSVMSFGTQEAGLHLYIDKGYIFGMLWSDKGRQRLVLKAPIKANNLQVIALQYNAQNPLQTTLIVNDDQGKIVHNHGNINKLIFDIDDKSSTLSEKLPILNDQSRMTLVKFGASNRFNGIFTEAFMTRADLNPSHMRALTDYLMLKWASVCLSLSVIDQRSQLESLGSARICISPNVAGKSVIQTKKADNPETIVLIIDKLRCAKRHLKEQEQLFITYDNHLNDLDQFSKDARFDRHGLETPEQIAQLLASSIKINLAQHEFSILEQRQSAALSLVYNKPKSSQLSQQAKKNEDDYIDLNSRALLPSMDEICDDVGF